MGDGTAVPFTIFLPAALQPLSLTAANIGQVRARMCMFFRRITLAMRSCAMLMGAFHKP